MIDNVSIYFWGKLFPENYLCYWTFDSLINRESILGRWSQLGFILTSVETLERKHLWLIHPLSDTLVMNLWWCAAGVNENMGIPFRLVLGVICCLLRVMEIVQTDAGPAWHYSYQFQSSPTAVHCISPGHSKARWARNSYWTSILIFQKSSSRLLWGLPYPQQSEAGKCFSIHPSLFRCIWKIQYASSIMPF